MTAAHVIMHGLTELLTPIHGMAASAHGPERMAGEIANTTKTPDASSAVKSATLRIATGCRARQESKERQREQEREESESKREKTARERERERERAKKKKKTVREQRKASNEARKEPAAATSSTSASMAAASPCRLGDAKETRRELPQGRLTTRTAPLHSPTCTAHVHSRWMIGGCTT